MSKHDITPVGDILSPDWGAAGIVQDWRNYISEELREMWGTFTVIQKRALARQANEVASREEWD